MKTVLAFDFGASTGRAIKAVFADGRISYREIHRFENIPIKKDGHMYHDVDMILREIDKAIDKAGTADALAFDTWGVDYALLDADGKMLKPPSHYRDKRTNGILEKAYKKMPADALYRETGNQIMPINTLFQLLTEENADGADNLLFMPDLFGFFLTGKCACEYTIASTSQMLSPESGKWSGEVLNTFGIDRSLFAPLTKAPTILGEYRGIKVITVAGHDTQCAVAAMPCGSGNAAFLSCGTWSLIGCETDEPILTEESRRLELSNEIGANGKINYLKNISGLWLIQELKRELAAGGESYTYNDLETLARKSEPFKRFIDPDEPSLASPGELNLKIADYCRRTAQPAPETVGETVRCIYESLALKYRLALEQISHCTGRSFDTLHMLGGGTKDGFLCEMTADSIGLPVIAGPIEATALGNITLQLIALGEIKSVEDGRKIIVESEKNTLYTPKDGGWDTAYEKFKATINKK